MLKKLLNTADTLAKNTLGAVYDRTKARLFGAGIVDGQLVGQRNTAKWVNRETDQDWRVRLTIPTEASSIREVILGNDRQGRMAPLIEEGGFHWPLTPTMVIQHTASYNPLSQTHSNYPFQAYQNSQVDQFNILGEFPVQNQQDAQYWVATVQFLRTVSKMFFGGTDDLRGNPPPILHLSGYGDHMFKRVPVVLNSFNVELASGIDYISTNQSEVYQQPQSSDFTQDSFDETWAPTLSTISVLVTPVYSREEIKNFNIRDFASGKLSQDRGIGFI